jgi:Carboxypeptidase regulatory-like domain
VFPQFTVVLPKKSIQSSVHGTVVDPAGAPVGGSLVEVIDTENQRTVASMVASQSGEFHFNSLPLGHHFRLRARKDGFCPLEIPLNVMQHQGAKHLKLKLVIAT